MAIRITIDKNKCKNPDECKKCLKACPAGVFMLLPTGKHQKMLSEPPKHTIKTHFTEMCSLCMVCVEVCPNNAIQIR
ncbi:MAG: 4Fe-4S binding protein [Candidatus Altiarchaeota archaeon]|nr:4Fe-4S binding protein [Candidatus Altiarchaeota archaeon]